MVVVASPQKHNLDTMDEDDQNRLWIGNLDEKITEYQLLKLLQKYGAIEKFDLLYHRNGPLAGKSRGYGFVSFKNRENAEKAMNELNGRFMISRNIAIKWAQAVKTEEDENAKLKPLLQLPVLTGPKGQASSQNQHLKIRAIEKKLKMMEQKSDLEEFLFEPATKKPKVLKNKPDTSYQSFKK